MSAEHAITIGVEDRVEGTGAIAGDLRLPERAVGLVVFAHGSGSSRHSPRNRMVAGELQRSAIGTLLLDLLTPAEEEVDLVTRHLRFDIALLAGRLVEAIDDVGRGDDTRDLPVGLFGASTGAAAAIIAAVARPDAVAAVVSRGGRPDLAGDALAALRAPTLLIVGGRDDAVIALNRDAAVRMTCPHEIAIVPGATHLFEEPGALEEVAGLATAWFVQSFSA
jgi:putative phosphoribosyl transferase